MKALFFDLDGTLLDSRKRIPASAVEALLEARKRGIKVFVATGRSIRVDKMLGWTEEVQLFDGGVYCNGACLHLHGQTRYMVLPPAVVRSVIHEVSRYPDVHLALNGEGARHAFNFTPPPSLMGPWGVTPQDIFPLDDAAIHSAIKMLIFYKELVNSTRPLPEELFPRLLAQCSDQAQMYLTDQGANIQIVSKGATKHAGIQRLCQELSLSEEEIVVFGDDLNDVEMLSRFPHSVAMGNAVPQARDCARYITRTNDQDGIAYALRELLHIL